MNDPVTFLEAAAAAMTLLVPLVALAAVALNQNWLVRSALSSARHRQVGRRLRRAGVRPRAIRRWVSARTGAHLSGEGSNVATELSTLFAVPGCGGLPSHGGDAGAVDRGLLRDLSREYVRMAARLRSRGLLGAGAAPVVYEVADLAERTATALAEEGSFERLEFSDPEALQVAGGQVSLHSFLGAPGWAGSPPGLVRSYYRRQRTVADVRQAVADAVEDGVAYRVLAKTHEQSARVDEVFSNHPKTFDGVLPLLDYWSLERDPRSGLTRLVVHLSECSFSTHVAFNYPGTPDSVALPLLTLSLVPTTADGYAVFLGRASQLSMSPGAVAPGVNGNLELRDRAGVPVDRDERGAPSPLLALLREAREELGLHVDAGRVVVLGLARLQTARERGTVVLVATAEVPQTVAQIAAGARLADPVEGAWELGKELLCLPLNHGDPAAVLAAAAGDDRLMPHTVAALHLLLGGSTGSGETVPGEGGRSGEAPVPFVRVPLERARAAGRERG